MLNRVLKYVFFLTVSVLLQANNSILSINSICTKPIEINTSIVSVCNYIDVANRDKNHPIKLLEIDKNLKISNTIQLDINHSDIGKIIKIDNEYAYLLGETTSHCIEVFKLHFNEYNVTKIMQYCDSSPFSFPFEGYNLTLLLEDNSLLFPVVLRKDNETVPQIMHVNSKKQQEVMSLEKYKGFIPIKFEKFHDKNILLMRSKENPFHSVLLAIVLNSEGNMQYSLLYETTDFIIMTLTNIDNKIYISGNAFKNDQVYFGLFEVKAINGVVDVLVDNIPLAFFPAFIDVNTTLEVIGITKGKNKNTVAITSYQIDKNFKFGIKLDTLDIVSPTFYPLVLMDETNVGFLLKEEEKAYLLFPRTKRKYHLVFSNIRTNMLYPSVFYFLGNKYISYIIKDGEYKSIIEKIND